MRKRYNSQHKAKVALQAIREQKSLAELSLEFGIHRMMIQKWKKQILQGLPRIFSNKKDNA